MSKPDLTIVDDLLARVRKEREDNIAKWGVQTHESYRGETARRQYEKNEAHFKKIWDAQKAKGRRTWDVILLEEVYEAVSELDPEERIYELVQVAAMALAEAESITLRGGRLLGEIEPGACPATGEPCALECEAGECVLAEADAEEAA